MPAEKKARKKRPALSSATKDTARSYCLSTSIHGLAYVASSTCTKEKLFWLATVIAGLVGGGKMVSMAFEGWAASPVLTVVRTFGFPIERVQYPTITICPGTGDDPWDYTKQHLNDCWRDAECTERMNDYMWKLDDWVFKTFSTLFSRSRNAETNDQQTISFESTVLHLVKKAVEPLVLVGHYQHYRKLRNLTRDVVQGSVDAKQELLKRTDLRMDLENKGNAWSWLGWIGRDNDEITDSLSNLYKLNQLAEERTSWMGVDECILNVTVDHSYKFRNETKSCVLSKNDDSVDAVDIIGNMTFFEACILKYCLNNADLKEYYFCYSIYDMKVLEDFCKHCKCTDVDIFFVDYLAKEVVLSLVFSGKRDMGTYVEGFLKTFRANPPSDYFQLSYPPVKSTTNVMTITPVDIALMFHKVSRSDFNSTEVSFSPDLIKLLKYSLYNARNVESSHIGGTMVLDGDNGDFIPSFTDDGLCLVSNGPSLNEAYHVNERMAIVANVLNMSEEAHPKLRNHSGSGTYVTRTFWLDARFFGTGSKAGFATIGINSFLDFFSVDSVAVEARAGRDTVIKVRSVLHEATDDLRTLSPLQRDCRFTDEWDQSVSIFKYYTQQACLFECKLKHGIMKVNCTPWDFPKLIDSSNEVCTNVGDKLFLFREAMRETPHETCDCLPNCEEVEFDVEVDTTGTDSDKLCMNKDGEERKMAMDFFKRHYDSLHWRLSFLSLGQRLTILDDYFADKDLQLFEHEVVRICRDVIDNDLAKLTIRIPKPRITVSTKMRRFTFADQLGTLGGTMGLFCGLSLISLVEIAFWIYKFALSLAVGGGH